jgi:hypothetical protein
MTRLEIEGAASLVADESDGYVTLTIDDGDNWETIFLDYSEVKRLQEWLAKWLEENQENA